jgi:DNA invertase Pin-like site-specific DNA recombinase
MTLTATHPKIHAEHRSRRAYVYVRQSTISQVLHHRESTERQYQLQTRALDLGWPKDLIEVIDEDQGQSAATAKHRTGFQRLAAEIGLGKVGLVLMLEASRLARSCSDWHRLIEICSVTHSLIADEAGVYDPRDPNDRLLLGMKGTLSEAELFTLRTRLYEGRWNKAKKGLLSRSIPTGYVLDETGRWMKDPDKQVQERITYIFQLFRREGIARNVLVLLRSEGLKLPVRMRGGPGHGLLNWKEATFGMLMRILHNPGYAGTYVYGEWEYSPLHRSEKTGKARARHREREAWPVCLVGHHEAYLAWEEFLDNQQRLRQNWFRSTTRGAPKRGPALLQGIVYCGRCGAKMQVNSHSVKEQRRPSYLCTHQYSTEGAQKICQSMSSKPVDDAVVSVFLEALAPAQIEVAVKALGQAQKEKAELRRQWEQQLTRAQYEVRLAQRQYDAVDPDNRLVAHTLEQRWNEKLEVLERLKKEFVAAEQESRFDLTEEEQASLRALASDLPRIFAASTTTDQERKQLLRHAIAEVQLDGVQERGQIEIRITWRSGAVTVKTVPRLAVGCWAPRTDEAVVKRIRALAPKQSATVIAATLDREGLKSAHGRSLREHHVLYIARSRGIPIHTVQLSHARSTSGEYKRPHR